MPIKNLVKKIKLDEKNLVDEIAEEMRSNGSTKDEPVIIEDRVPTGIRLYVIWSRWAGVDDVARSRIILEAYEKAKKEDVMRVTLSMGLTKKEAENLGITWE